MSRKETQDREKELLGITKAEFRKIVEEENRKLRGISLDKSANVSTYQYNMIKLMFGVTGDADTPSVKNIPIHGNRRIELAAFNNALSRLLAMQLT